MITAAPNAPLGSVLTLPSYSPADFPPTSAILCRNTTPLITFAFDLLRRNAACHIVGRDIAVGLEKLLDRCDDGTPGTFSNRLLQIKLAECERLRRKGKLEAADAFSDRCSALAIIARGATSVAQIRQQLAKVFADGPGITLSTGHRAKGLEWETVFLLDWSLLPSKYATTVAALRQEKNLQYVMVTRAKLNLCFINSANWKS